MRFLQGALAACLLAVALVGPVDASAATRLAGDPRTGLTFELEGRVLTVVHAPPGGNVALDPRPALLGRRVNAFCGKDFEKRRTVVRRTRLWPKDRVALRFRFDRDVSRSARACLLERPGGADIGGVDFAPPPGLIRGDTFFVGEAFPIEGSITFFTLRNSRGRLYRR